MAKLSPPITLKVLKELKLTGEIAEVADGACPGLRIRVGTAGAMTWSLLARDSDGKRKRIECGQWPEIGIPEAREIANKFKASIKRETAPVEQLTLADVITLYSKTQAGEKPSWPEAKRSICKTFDSVKDERAGALTSHGLQRIADNYPSRTSASAAIRYLRPVLRWAARRNMVNKSIWSELEQPATVKKRNRVLSEAELMRILLKLGTKEHGGAVKMMLITACRREEVCAMRFEDIVEDVWYIPAENRKNKEEIRVPLTWYAQTIVGAQGETSGLVFRGSKGKPLDNWDRWQKRIFTLTNTSGWHRHDLRRTAATLLGDAGIAPHIIEIVLGHKVAHTELASIYNQSRYDKEHEEALKVLSDIICGMEIRAKQNDQP
jgi:integrase